MSGLADWAAPYITNYLGQAQALGNAPYQTYQGPLTAGESSLQTDAFKGIGSLTVGDRGTYNPVGGSFTDQYFYPSGMTFGGRETYNPVGGSSTDQYSYPSGMTFGEISRSGNVGTMGGESTPTTSTAGYNPNMVGFTQPRSVAEQYMNPYLQQALDPQLKELQRQSDIARLGDASRLTKAGAFGGSRQAIMESEGRRNLLDKQSGVLSQGYADAYDKAMQQFNADQQRKVQEAQFGADFGLKGLGAERDILNQQLGAGAVQRGITSEGVAADLAEFNQQRDFPYKQLQFQRDMISGLPTGSVTNTPAQLSGIAQLVSSVGGIDQLLKATGQKDLGELLRGFGLSFGGGEVV
jgi:hypothetical protein